MTPTIEKQEREALLRIKDKIKRRVALVLMKMRIEHEFMMQDMGFEGDGQRRMFK